MVILYKDQFEAVRSAMVALNNINSRILAKIIDEGENGLNVFENVEGEIHVVEFKNYIAGAKEIYKSQAEFFGTYEKHYYF